MCRSESLIDNLLKEVESLSNRLTNIMRAYCNTSHIELRKRFLYENKTISQRLNEIYAIAKVLKIRNTEKISFSSLLFERCERTIAKTKMEKDLFSL